MYKGLFQYYEKLLDGLSRDLGFKLTTPWKRLSSEVQQAVLHGDNFEVKVKWKNRYGREMSYTSGFEGVVPYIERQYVQAETDVDLAVCGARGHSAPAARMRGGSQARPAPRSSRATSRSVPLPASQGRPPPTASQPQQSAIR